MVELAPFFMFGISTTLTPGPNNFMLMNSGLNFGIRKSLPHYLGICIGFPLMMLLVALGFGAIFSKYAWLKSVLKVLGASYILYLAWKTATAHTKVQTNKSLQPFGFMQAILFQWVNPKAWLMAIGATSIFSFSSNYLNNALLIGVLFFVIVMPCIGVWLLFGASLQKILKNEKHRIVFNMIMALGLVASVVAMFFD